MALEGFKSWHEPCTNPACIPYLCRKEFTMRAKNKNTDLQMFVGLLILLTILVSVFFPMH